jgi:hypothetical protein
VPEWLQPLGPKPVPPSAHLTPAQPIPGQPRPKPAARKAAPVKKKNGGNQALAILLGLLALLTIVVLVFLVYLLFF